MSELRLSIETTYNDNTHVTQNFTIYENEIDSLHTEDTSIWESLLWISEMMSTEQRLLEIALSRSIEESEIQRDEDKYIDVCTRKYEDEEKEDTCTICSDKFIIGDEVAVLSCSHIFHSKCIEEWGHYKAECPLCKRSIPVVKENLAHDKEDNGMEQNI